LRSIKNIPENEYSIPEIWKYLGCPDSQKSLS
jgi:hypothetical protein